MLIEFLHSALALQLSRLDFFLIILGIFTLSNIYSYYINPFRKQNIPGPFLARFTCLYRFFFFVQGKWHRDLIQLHDKYGTVVWIAPNELSVSDPRLRSVIYGFAVPKKDTFFSKSPMFETGNINDNFNFLFERDPERARLGKYTLSYIFSEKGLAGMEEAFDKTVDGFCEGLNRHNVQTGKLCDFSAWSRFFSMDLCTELACNYSGGFCRSGKDKNNTVASLTLIFDVVGTLMMLPVTLQITTRWIRKHLLLIPFERLFQSVLLILPGSGGKKQRMAEIRKESPQTLLSRFFTSQSQIKKRFGMGNDTEGITNHLFTLIAGVVGVNANIFPLVMNHLLENPEALRRVREELSTLPPGPISVDTWARLQGKENKVPYLEAAVQEAIRLGPIVGFSLSRVVPAVGCMLNQYYVPPGYIVGMSAWPVNYSKEYFGEDVAEFKPDRWFGYHPTELARDGTGGHKTNRAYIEAGWLSFGAGARVCLGRYITVFSVMKFLGTVLREFDFELVEPPRETLTFAIKSDGMKLKVGRRV